MTTVTVLASGSSGVDASSRVTAAFSPSANAKLFAFLDMVDADGTPSTPSASDPEISWSLHATTRYNPNTSGDSRLTVWHAFTSGAPGSTQTTFTFGDTMTFHQWAIVEITPDVDFTVGSDGWLQGGTIMHTADASPHQQDLSFAIGDTNNIYLACFARDNSANMTAQLGFTELAGSWDANTFCLMWKVTTDLDQTAEVTSGATGDFGIYVGEIAVAAANPTSESMALATASALSGAAIAKINGAMDLPAASAEHLPLIATANAPGAVTEQMAKMTATAEHLPQVTDANELEIDFGDINPKVYQYKIYAAEDHTGLIPGEFIGMWETTHEPVWTWPINGGQSSLTYQLPRPFGQAGERGERGEAEDLGDLRLGNRVDVYVVDREAALGVLIYSGRIEEYEVTDPSTEAITVTLLPLSTRIIDSFVDTEHMDLILEGVTDDITEIVEDMVNTYLPGITWSPSNPLVGKPPDATWGKSTVKDALELMRRLAGSEWYWRIGPDKVFIWNKWNLKNTATHQFVGDHITRISYIRSRMERKTRVLVYGAESHDEFGVMLDRVVATIQAPNYDSDDPRDLVHTDSRVTTADMAYTVGRSLLDFHNQDLIETEIVIVDSNQDANFGYNIEDIKPGDTVTVFNPHQVYHRHEWGGSFQWGVTEWGGSFAGLVQGPLVIAEVSYEGTTVRIKLTNRPAAVIEELVNVIDRQLLEGST